MQVVPDSNVLGIAFGTISSVENAVVLASGVGVGSLRDSSGSYQPALWYLFSIAGVGCFCAITLRCLGVSTPTPMTSPDSASASLVSSNGHGMELSNTSREHNLNSGGASEEAPLLASSGSVTVCAGDLHEVFNSDEVPDTVLAQYQLNRC
jgi:hypothetical protein